MKPTALLTKQHHQVKALFKKLESGRSDAATLLVELSNALAAHMAIEQEIYDPVAREVDKDLVMASFEEHALAEIALKRLLATKPTDPAFQARVTATKELIEHHVEEEEEDLFPEVDKAIAEDRLRELGQRMEVRFDEVVAEGFEAAVPEGFARTSSDVAKASAA